LKQFDENIIIVAVACFFWHQKYRRDP